MNNLDFYLELDKKRFERDKRINNGLKVEWIRITFIYENKGFGIREYELPFDKDKLN